ncbi:CotH kinase family protein [Vitiosangium sp. GDMCC 1.1324]|uniref:CotH kinase family protein n=1 Tax=Vitiosangium sp. (strain GDMCC 1.1324) TaxID=2138576 RepID=UPI000D38AD55|nr:CotH kinase family protein [Vitiosangium sp. GDMCC 1.1324]PTL84179.1 cellulosomal protein [Vitiosangium sp. GDMCC 1.1324]
MKRSPHLGALATLAIAFTTACGGVDRPDGWTEASHGKDAAPAYDVVFPQGKVQRIDLVITPEDWQTMQDDMTGMLGAFGSGGGMGPGGGVPGGNADGGVPGGGGPGGGGGGFPTELTQACVDKAEGDSCTATFMGSTFTSTCTAMQAGQLICRPPFGPGGGGGGAPDGGGVPGGGGGGDLLPNTPVYVPSTVRFNGKTWQYVGVRMKGNSSLSQTWRSGVGKLPFRLNFDKFEDEHPEIEDQRFYGFKKLSFGNGAADTSLLRDKVATQIFREFGVPAGHTAFVALYVDHGEGSQYFGLYTLDEDPEEPLLDRSFGSHKGALYEADGTGARWGTFDQESFEIQANEEQGWAPVEEAIAALNSDRTDAAAWRARLEAKLDVDGFLKWLAVNTVLQNWDAYGGMSHNYFLYADPNGNGRLRWITWDHDRSMGEGMGRATSLTQDNVDATWPLIRYLMDDPTYFAIYKQYALEAARGPLAPDKFQARLREEHDLIAPWVVGENAEQPGYTFISNTQAFEDSLTGTSGLLNFAAKRQAEVETAFGTSP